MAAPTLIAVSTVGGAVNNVVASDTSASLSWQIGDVLVAVASNEGFTSATWSITNTGTGLSWVPQQVHNTTSADSGAAVWTAVATGAGSGTVSVAQSGSQNMAMGVYQFRAPVGGSIGVGNSKIGTGLTSSPQQVALTMSSVDSAVVWAAGDFSAGVAESPSPAATSHSNVSPGPSASPGNGVVSTRFSWYVDELDDETSTGNINFGYTGSSAGAFSIVAVEVTSTSPASATGFQPHRMPLGV